MQACVTLHAGTDLSRFFQDARSREENLQYGTIQIHVQVKTLSKTLKEGKKFTILKQNKLYFSQQSFTGLPIVYKISSTEQYEMVIILSTHYP